MTPVATEAIEQQALTTVQQARLVVVKTVEDRGLAAEIGRGIAALDKEAEEYFAPMKKAAAAAHKEICAKENAVREPLAAAKRYLSVQIGGFDTRVEMERRAEEARLQELARIEAESEAKRQAEEQAITDAIELEAQGDAKGAAAVLNNPVPPQRVYVPAVIVPRQVPATAGVSGSTVWKIRITNPDLVPREYCIPDEKTLAQMAKALKSKFKVPGVEAFPESGARFRA